MCLYSLIKIFAILYKFVGDFFKLKFCTIKAILLIRDYLTLKCMIQNSAVYLFLNNGLLQVGFR